VTGLVVGLVTAISPGYAEETEAETRPNFIFILSDDQAPDTVGAWGNPGIKTPNIDRLSAAGVNFLNTYNPGSWSGAVCIPSRTMLNSGLSVWRSRKANHSNGLERVPFWSHVMRDAGYATYMTGKWHLKVLVEQAYQQVRHRRPGMPKVVPSTHPDAYNRPIEGVEDTWDPADPSRGGFWEGGKHWSEVVADDAELFLEQAAASEQPFFMYLAFNAPHDPRQAPQEYIDLYPLDEIELPENYLPAYPYADQIGAPHSLRDEFLAPMPRTEHAIKVHRQEYYAITSHMDAQIGRILDALEASGKADNTYIIFTSDHGLAVGRHGFMGKQNAYEHSVRVPFIMVGPGMEAGRSIEERIYLQDVVPTVMELAGAEVPGHVDFRSLLPLINDEAKAHYPAIYGAYKGKQRMVIEDDWKLIVYPDVPVLRLYNLAEDPLEVHDLAEDPDQAPRIRQLFARLQALQKELDDPLDLSGMSSTVVQSAEIKKESLEAYKERMQWFADSRYGLFIHFGGYSQLGGVWKGKEVEGYSEWIQGKGQIDRDEYAQVALQFNPTEFNADLIVKNAKDAGMTYLVITAKHHEGFCLWDSAYTEFDVASTPFKGRDILQELKEACAQYGIQFGLYYSIIDWHHPSQARPFEVGKEGSPAKTLIVDDRKQEYVDYQRNQVLELVEKYDPAILWFDGDWANWWTLEDGIKLYNQIRSADPDVIVNNRVAKRNAFELDYVTQEQKHFDDAFGKHWEGCYTMNKSWGYKKNDDNWKSPETVYNKLKDINEKGGALLLNVGPDGQGVVQDEAWEILRETAELMKENPIKKKAPTLTSVPGIRNE